MPLVTFVRSLAIIALTYVSELPRKPGDFSLSIFWHQCIKKEFNYVCLFSLPKLLNTGNSMCLHYYLWNVFIKYRFLLTYSSIIVVMDVVCWHNTKILPRLFSTSHVQSNKSFIVYCVHIHEYTDIASYVYIYIYIYI